MKTMPTDKHERLREAHQAANAFDKDSYVTIKNSDLGALLAERDALRVALEDELTWHEARCKVLSKQPDAYTGHNWGRWIQHQEHAAAIRAALGQGGDDAL